MTSCEPTPTPLHHRRVTEPPDTDSSADPSLSGPSRPLTNRGRRLELIAEVGGASVARPQPEAAPGGWMVQPSHPARGRCRPLAGCRARSGRAAHRSARRGRALWLGVLHAGDGAVLSHLTAAKRAGLRWTGRRRHPRDDARGDAVLPLPGYLFHQTRRPYERWVKPVAGPPRLPLEHAALLAAERDHNVRRAIGLLAACVQQRLTTAERFGRAIPQIRKLRHGMTFRLVLDDIAGGAQSFAEINVGRLCAEYGLLPPDPASRTARQGGSAPLPRLRVGPGGRAGRRAGGRRVVPRRGTSPGGRT